MRFSIFRRRIDFVLKIGRIFLESSTSQVGILTRRIFKEISFVIFRIWIVSEDFRDIYGKWIVMFSYVVFKWEAKYVIRFTMIYISLHSRATMATSARHLRTWEAVKTIAPMVDFYGFQL